MTKITWSTETWSNKRLRDGRLDNTSSVDSSTPHHLLSFTFLEQHNANQWASLGGSSSFYTSIGQHTNCNSTALQLNNQNQWRPNCSDVEFQWRCVMYAWQFLSPSFFVPSFAITIIKTLLAGQNSCHLLKITEIRKNTSVMPLLKGQPIEHAGSLKRIQTETLFLSNKMNTASAVPIAILTVA